MRQVVLDTETTGLDPTQGHRIVEIGCIEIEDRKLTGKNFQVYLNPEREIDEAAMEVHGLTLDFLSDKPKFYDIHEEFLKFIKNSELIIHNAPFDVGFLNSELEKLQLSEWKLEHHCSVLDSLILARQKHPGQRNSLDALCKRYGVNNNHRELHGALLDAEILADVYLVMTSGQSSLSLKETPHANSRDNGAGKKSKPRVIEIPIHAASPAELEAHNARLQDIHENSEGGCLWLSSESKEER